MTKILFIAINFVAICISYHKKKRYCDRPKLELVSCFCCQEASGEASSIADMLRATAEEAMNQTNFVFDESSGMYYDHSTGFYYDSVSLALLSGPLLFT